MLPQRTVVLSILSTVAWSFEMKFPPSFKFGAASSSYQIEGGWNASDKTPNIWDKFTHDNPNIIKNGDNGDVACDSYNLWERDIEMASELGLQFYRFSISWTRLLPNGYPNCVSENGIRYYDNLINGLLEKGIEPIVTIYHWELPQRFQDLGGWTNSLVSDWLADYARVVFSLYSDRVKTWITVNEPSILCDFAYNTGLMAPGITDPEHAVYLCTKNTLIAHAKAWRIYDREFKPRFHGRVSVSHHIVWFEGKDEELTELVHEYSNARFTHPIYTEVGGWPRMFEKYMAEKSRNQGYTKSRLPEFTEEEIELCKGTYDFFGLNFYVARLVRLAKPGEQLGPFPIGDIPELDVKLEVSPDWGQTKSLIRSVYPESIRHMLNWIKENCGDVDILVTENGYGTSTTGLDDHFRVQYYRDYMEQVLLAIKEDGVNVIGYTAWTLMDNFEWSEGYTVKYGLYEVNFTSPQRTRTPRASAHFYKTVIANRSLPPKALVDNQIKDEL
ncbi:hypothetical protein K1T71_012871 [Dendrolimus kikuchii]|uniref:Uncharacterized protein n=1 Tax=Dendrolimus kikuchii TaxID=765133 RepID=A0ACC1CIL2_9NEOP|nr:hypothetical protein K1T71_012871 [Dendrolimus kikuchii]